MLDTKQSEFYLFGAAGCGKTFLTRHFIDEVIPQYKNLCKALNQKPCFDRMVLTATTNKAVEVLAQLQVDYRPITVYKLFGVTVKDDANKGISYLNTYNAKVVYKNLIFIDECSMLPAKMLSLIRYQVRDCKIVFIGDRFQLAPVKEKPHWDNTDPNWTVDLQTPVRNQGNPALTALCAQLRKTVETGIFEDIKTTPGSVDHVSAEEAQEWLRNANYERSKILCYTNNKVLQYQEWIHEDLHPGEDLYKQSGIYINNSNAERGGTYFYPEEQLVIQKIHGECCLNTSDSSYSLNVLSADVYSSANHKKVKHMAILLDSEEYKNTLKEAYKNKDYDAYFELKNTVLDLRLPYACTVHKSQGNTYDEVYIDLDSFKSCKDPSIAARLLYVAVSRAKNRVVLYGELPKKYGAVV